MGGEPTRVYVILGSEAEVLFARGDGNSDGRLDLSDAVFVLSYLFLGGPEPPPPYPERGEDPTADALSCRWAGG